MCLWFKGLYTSGLSGLLLSLLIVFSPVRMNAQIVRRDSVRELFAPSHQGIIVVAHRGCHDPAPDHGFGYSPENSSAALEHCVAMGVDMMETDIRMTADGYLVIMHDDTVDRTTNGHGKVSDLALADLRKLRLRQNLGGYDEPLTEERVLTLKEMLSSAKGRITLNLDVKDSIYAEVVDAVLRSGASDLVTVKTRAGIASPPLAAIEPFNRLPFIPILSGDGSDMLAIAKRQMEGTKPVAFELPHTAMINLPMISAFAKEHSTKIFINTLGDGFLAGLGGDNDALKDPDAVWGWLQRNGALVIQTDRPEALLKYRSLSH